MAEIVLRQMTPADLDRVMEIEVLSFPSPWPREDMEYEITCNGAARYYVLEEDGRVMAYAGVWFLIGEGHVTSVAVHPEARGRGYGVRIVEHMMRSAMELGIQFLSLEVRQNNLPAQKLYKKMGFKKAGLKEGYYEDTGEDAVIMLCINPELALYRLKRQEELKKLMMKDAE